MTFSDNTDLQTLEELCKSIQDGDWIETKDQSSAGYRLLQIGNIAVGKFRESGKPRFVSEDTFRRLNCTKIEIGDVLIARMPDPTGRAWCVDAPIPDSITSVDVAIVRVDPTKLDAKYLAYFLNQKSTLRLIASLQTGSTRQRIKRSDLARLEILTHSLEIQQAIANFLTNLDDKIAANNRLSKTLEDIAQTIFKSWFIDFDPVKAKMEGGKPVGMDAATAALFPDAMEESALGLIPKGWSWITVGDIATVIDCLHAKKPELLEQGYPYLQLDTISDSGVLRFENAGLISKEDYVKWTSRIEVQGGDCLITNVGRVGAVSQVPEHFKAAIGRNITAIRAKDPLLQRSFLKVALLSDFMKKEIKRNTDSGTILEALNVKNIPKLIIPGPSDAVLLEFAKLCDPLQLQIQELYSMSVNLKKIRDSLLPRLISGELQIPEEMLAS
jgi:type I restriction enzyme S subunit